MGQPRQVQTGLVSIIFSFRNEEEVIPEMVRQITDAMRDIAQPHELVFVNDASTDRSLEVLLKLRESHPKIRIVNMSRRFGPSEGVLAGLENCSGEAAIYMDVDLQDPPSVCKLLIEKWRAGADVVHTVRRRRLGETRTKLALTHLAYRFISFGSEIQLLDNAGDFKLISRRVIDEILKLPECDPYLRGLVTWVGFKQAVVEYERQPRAAGVSKFPLWQRGPWKMFVTGLTSHSFLPIYVVFAFSLLGIFAGPFVLLAVALEALPPMAVLYYVMWLMLMFSQSAVGVYAIRAYKDSRRRPRWIISNVIG